MRPAPLTFARNSAGGHTVRYRIACSTLCFVAVAAHAQSAVATSSVNVRAGQTKASRVRDHLSAGDTVQLLSPSLRRGYYHVEEANGTTGWVYRRFLTILEEPSVAPVPSPVPSPSATTGVAPVGGVAPTVDPAWDKPALETTVFHRVGFANCGLGGSGGDTPTNLRKNRTDEPTSVHGVTFDAVLGLPYPVNHRPQRQSWPQSDLDVIAPYEGIPVAVTAFIARQRGIIVENAQHSSNGESTNCHATDDAGVDWHVTLVKRPDDPKSTGIVVEVTPRIRANGHPWTPAMLAPAVANGDSVRVSGWLLYDPEHFPQTTNYDPAHPSSGATVRATLWEVHPVTRLEVFDSATGQWRELPE
jgi:uncharacterized protein YraI